MATMLNQYQDVILVFPAHPNPKVQQAIKDSGIQNHPRCIVMQALNYPNFIMLLKHASWIMTDSGGIQEEAIALKKPIIVMRNETERYEGILAGLAMLVGYDSKKILQAVARCYAMKLNEVISLPAESPTEQIVSFIEHEYILKFQSKSYNSFVQGAL
jgi:UDP-N-acetylglucosamine 2-epimerase